MNENKVAISVTIDRSVFQELRERAHAQDRSLSWLLNNAAREWLSTQPPMPSNDNTDRAQLAALK